MINKVPFNYIFIDNTKKAIKIPKEKYLSAGTIPVVDQGQKFIGGYVDGLKGYTNIPCIIFGDHTRIIKYVDFPFTIGADGVKLLNICNSDFIPKFLFYHLSYYKIPNIGYNRHFKFLKELHFIKYDLQTQQKIVEELDCLSDIIEKKKQQLAELDKLIESQFIEMFEKEKKVKLQDFCKFQQGTQVPIELQFETRQVGSTRFLRIIDYTQAPQPPRYVNVKGRIVDEHSVVVVRYGASAGFVGHGYLGILANNLFEIIPNEQIILKDFLYCNLKYGNFEKEISKKCAGVAMPALSFGMMNDIEVYAPTIENQKKFINLVEHIDKLKFDLKQSIDETQNLFNERMQHYFGE